MKEVLTKEYAEFIEELKNKVAESRYKAASSVNKELILLYHHIGTEILSRQETHGWGTKVIERLSKDLTSSFPEMKGFSPRNLKYMRLFAYAYKDFEFVQQVAAQLPWFHIVVLIERVKDEEEREFYVRKAIENGWSRNVMVHHIESDLYKREGKAITNFKDKLPSPHSDLAIRTLRDPYCFDFLSIGSEAHEREIEKSLVYHIEKFLLELGEGFAFLGRQYHLAIGNKDYFLDLLFYHVKLRCFVIGEIKAKDFKPEHAGKMNFYLSAVDDLLKHPSDNPSIGLILCKSKDQVTAEYALRKMDQPIGIAEYNIVKTLPKNIQTELPTIEELETELTRKMKPSKKPS